MRLRMSLAKYKVLDNEWERHVGRFVKGSISSAHARQIVERDLLASHQQSVAKAARKKLDGKVAQKGVITVGDVRAKTSKCCQNEVEMTRLACERAQLAAEKKQIALDKRYKRIARSVPRQAKLFYQRHNQ